MNTGAAGERDSRWTGELTSEPGGSGSGFSPADALVVVTRVWLYMCVSKAGLVWCRVLHPEEDECSRRSLLRPSEASILLPWIPAGCI